MSAFAPKADISDRNLFAFEIVDCEVSLYQMPMISAGYLYKNVEQTPNWLKPGLDHVLEVCSASSCVSENTISPDDGWKHNGFGFANSEQVLIELNKKNQVDLSEARLFYYEAYEQELDSDGREFKKTSWRPVSPLPSAGVETNVEEPIASARLELLGYDVVNGEDYLFCSPLSCNSMAKELLVNEHCLFDDLASAIRATEDGSFQGCSQGIYRIFSVHSVAKQKT